MAKTKDAIRVANNDYEIINGKPYLGVWFAFTRYTMTGNTEPEKVKAELQEQLDEISYFEKRHIVWIERPGHVYEQDPLILFGTVGVKFMLWGRAYRTMHMLSTGTDRWTKVRVNGRYRWRKANKRSLSLGNRYITSSKCLSSR